VVQLHREVERIEAAGAELVVVGNGAAHFIAGFRELTGFEGPIYTDPSLKVYEAAHLERGVFKVINPKAALSSIRAIARGGKPGRVQGDALQQGGVLVIAPGSELVWQHTSKYPGDNATVDQIVTALQTAKAS
jgi:hypothetical protein